MSSTEQIHAWAERLRRAEAQREPIAPLRDEMPADGETAYAVQQANVAFSQAQGRRIVFLTRLSPVLPFVLQNYAYGLTRVALKKGSLVVNSSQGGGSKDTWVLADAPVTEPETFVPGRPASNFIEASA